MMDLDSAIQHCKEQVQEQAKRGCYSCAEEHQQLAEWLKELKAYKEQGGDTISRQAAIRAIEALQRPIMREESNYYQFKFSGMSEALGAVENLPSVTPQPRTGRWIKDGQGGRYKWMCSNCGTHHRALYDYCPSCGTRMEVEE
jgi:rubrerythrin